MFSLVKAKLSYEYTIICVMYLFCVYHMCITTLDCNCAQRDVHSVAKCPLPQSSSATGSFMVNNNLFSRHVYLIPYGDRSDLFMLNTTVLYIPQYQSYITERNRQSEYREILLHGDMFMLNSLSFITIRYKRRKS